jgi:heterodisulfide reductase subunit A
MKREEIDMPKVGVFVCHCGTNIASVVDVKQVVAAAEATHGVVVAKDLRYSCSDLGQSEIRQAIAEHALDTVVVAACSPRMHEQTFMKCLTTAGINPYKLEIANIREQCSWVHLDKNAATKKAIDLTRMAIGKATRLQELKPAKSPVTKKALVIGGGIAGMQTALSISKAGYQVTLVEKSPSIGGRMAQLEKTFPTLDCGA